MMCSDCGQSFHKPTVGPVGISSYYCNRCKNEMFVWEDIKKNDYVFEHDRYRMYCDTEKNRSLIQRIYMDIESDTSITYRWYTLLELPTIPKSVTEENFAEKLKLYLLFS